MGRRKGGHNRSKDVIEKEKREKEARKQARIETEQQQKEATSSFERAIHKWKQFLDVARGSIDIRQRFSFMFEPKEPRSASNLSSSQAEFVEDANLAVKYFPFLQPLKELADEILLTTPSVGGERMQKAIEFQRASKGEASTQVGIFQGLKDTVTRKSKEGKKSE